MADLNSLAVTLPDGIDVAELHGLVCGLACADPAGDPEVRQRILWDLLGDVPGAEEPGGFAGDEMPLSPVAQFAALAEDELADEHLAFMPLLPDDDEALEHRLAALAEWCSGFLAGYGAIADAGDMPPDVTEALTDIARIAEVDPAAAGSGSESDFVQVLEYLKVAVLVLRSTETGATGPPDDFH